MVKNTAATHLERNEGESLDTAYGPTGFSAFMRPRVNIYVARCVLGCIVWMCIIKMGRHTHMHVANEESKPFTRIAGRRQGLFKMDLLIPPGFNAHEDPEMPTKW